MFNVGHQYNVALLRYEAVVYVKTDYGYCYGVATDDNDQRSTRDKAFMDLCLNPKRSTSEDLRRYWYGDRLSCKDWRAYMYGDFS